MHGKPVECRQGLRQVFDTKSVSDIRVNAFIGQAVGGAEMLVLNWNTSPFDPQALPAGLSGWKNGMIIR